MQGNIGKFSRDFGFFLLTFLFGAAAAAPSLARSRSPAPAPPSVDLSLRRRRVASSPGERRDQPLCGCACSRSPAPAPAPAPVLLPHSISLRRRRVASDISGISPDSLSGDGEIGPDETFLMAGLSAAINPNHLFDDNFCRSTLPPFMLKHFPQRPFRRFLSVRRLYGPLTIVASSVHPPSTMSATVFDNTLPSKEVLEIWRSADAVCFDVDSTLCLDEGIDELADFCGAGKAVAEWTTRAMSGSVPFEEALAARLSLFNPSLSQLHDFLDKKPPRISPGITELLNKLKANSTDVYLISGGFRQMINPVALQLGIPLENIFANQLLFGTSGDFLGFDTKEFTSRSGGKATAVQHIRKAHGYKALVMIGDGATDLEARQPGGADIFICYGGVQLRRAVAAKADWLVFNFQELLNSLE